MESFGIPGRYGLLLPVLPGTIVFLGWITHEYPGLRNLLLDRDLEFVNLKSKLQKVINQDNNGLIVVDPTGFSWIMLSKGGKLPGCIY